VLDETLKTDVLEAFTISKSPLLVLEPILHPPSTKRFKVELADIVELAPRRK
jgi:hypothetical protein